MGNTAKTTVRAWVLRYARFLFGNGDADDRALLVQLAMLLVAVSAQAITVIDTWSVWTVRQVPVNLPALGLPAVSFGWLMLLGLLPIFWRPRWGVAFYGLLLVAAVAFDQYRLQPQFIGIWVLLLAGTGDRGEWLARWYLVALWTWAGLHKLLAVEWSGLTTWSLLERAGLDPHWYLWLLVAIIAFEIFTGLSAVFWPKVAAVACVTLHVGILVFLSPAVLNANSSVWAWNAATAIIGAWLFWQAAAALPKKVTHGAIVAVLMLSPALYYVGWLHPRLAHMLYVRHTPQAWATSETHFRTLHGWGGLGVPFPDSHRLLIQAFELTARPGDKLVIADPRTLIEDRYFFQDASGQAVPIDRQRFYSPPANRQEVVGIEGDHALAVFRLEQAGAELKRDEAGLVIEVHWANAEIGQREIECLAALPNLRSLTLDNAKVDVRLATLKALPYLEALTMSACRLNDSALDDIDSLRSLRWLDLHQTHLAQQHVNRIAQLAELEVLQLSKTNIHDETLLKIATMGSLVWLDLSDTKVTSEGVTHLIDLANCEWLDLRGTEIDDAALASLATMKSLQTLDLRQTDLTPAAVGQLQNQLPSCQILR